MLVPGSVNPLLLTSAAGAAAGGVSRSIRLNAPDSAHLSRTPGSAGNRRTWTWAGWVKRSALGSTQHFLGANNNGFVAGFGSGDELLLYDFSGSFNINLNTTQVFRDPSAWAHFVFTVDTTQATNSNRVKIYVNGVQVTVFSTATYPSQNFDTGWNAAVEHRIGHGFVGSNYFSGYLADIYFIDGQALTPSSFTETDATTGQLIPLAYTGSYGTNGFHLEFSDNSGTTSTTLGKDSAGSNNFTPNNFSVSSGAGNDSLVDVPVNGDQTDTGVGGEVRGNYCTLNAADNNGGTLSNGNLQKTTTGATNVSGTIGMPSGKWYWEITVDRTVGGGVLGIGAGSAMAGTALSSLSKIYGYAPDGNKYANTTASSYGASYTAGDIIGIKFDADTRQLEFLKNNSSQGVAFTVDSGFVYFPQLHLNNTDVTANWGARPFAYTAPSGFKALCTANLPAPVVTKPNTVMDVKLYTGTGSTQTISGLQFNPDFLWIKNRDTAGYNHHLTDIVRGVTQRLRSNTTGAELTTTDQVTAYTSTGFTLGADSAGPGDLECNQNSKSYVAWAWDAGTSTVTNTQGSITSTVRANPTAGFSIVTWTGNATLNASIGHGLGAVPRIAFIKNRSTTTDWLVYTTLIDGTADFLKLNTTAAKADLSSNVATSTLYYLDNGSDMNGNGNNMVGYFFAPVAGYSSFGSYVGNGSSTDNTFVYTGMRPRFVMLKRSDSTGNWVIWDAVRNSYNVANSIILPNTSAAEYSPDAKIDILSNGFKVRDNSSDSGTNGATYIYAAFAEAPFNFSRAR